MRHYGTKLIAQITQALAAESCHGRFRQNGITPLPGTSAVMLLLGPHFERRRFAAEPCLILNKRSLQVKQPGDLCCPGGSISSLLDPCLARILLLPGSPLKRWPHWPAWRRRCPGEARVLATLLAAGLRESFEEMRLNPFRVQFLGPMPPQRLVMFRRKIYPMVCWVHRQKRFYPNWEVEKIVFIPLRELLNPDNYACYRLNIEIRDSDWKEPGIHDFPCFVHRNGGGSEILWGATFRMAMAFLHLLLGFKCPDMQRLPVVHGRLDGTYLTGSPR